MRSLIVRVSVFGLGVALMVCASAAPASAALVAATPEIDGSSLAAGLAGLSAGVLILRARLRTRK